MAVATYKVPELSPGKHLVETQTFIPNTRGWGRSRRPNVRPHLDESLGRIQANLIASQVVTGDIAIDAVRQEASTDGIGHNHRFLCENTWWIKVEDTMQINMLVILLDQIKMNVDNANNQILLQKSECRAS